MKAAYLTGARPIEVREVPQPLAPADGIVVQVKACGLCGSDLRRWKEGPPPGAETAARARDRRRGCCGWHGGGRDYAVGDHLAVAPDVHCGACYYCQRGQFNLCDNLRFLGITPGYAGRLCRVHGAQRLRCWPTASCTICTLAMSFVQAALAEPCSSVLAAHDKAGTSLGDTVLVMGGGPIGCLHIQVAKARGRARHPVGAEPGTARDCRPLRRRAVLDPASRRCGAARARRRPAAAASDIVVCANPVAATQTQAVEAVRKGGRVILFGGLPKANPMTSLDANRIHYGEIDRRRRLLLPSHLSRSWRSTCCSAASSAPTVVTHTFPLAEVGAGFADGGCAKASALR